MTQNIKAKKEELKEELCKEIDRYYEELSAGLEGRTIKIDDIESMLGETQKKVVEMVRESTGETVTGTEAPTKKECAHCGGDMRRHGKPVEIRIRTLSGEIKYKRDYYYCRKCGQGKYPRDEELCINGLSHKMTKSLMAETAFYGQSQPSFERARLMLRKALKMDINEETIRQVTETVGELVFKQDTERAEKTLKNIDKIGDDGTATSKNAVLYIQIDGAAVNTRVEDENGSTWRENKTVLVFRDTDMIRRKDGGHIITKKEYMPLMGTSEEFKKYVLDAAVRAGYGTISQVVVIADGAAWIKTICNEIMPDAIMILDLYHLRENIYTYAKNKFPNAPAKYTAWAESAIKMVENEEGDKLLELLPEGEKLPVGCVNLSQYISNNLDRMKYKTFKEKGYFVGSGAIESGNKLIVQQRLKQAGMRWSVPGAQSVLSLRAKDESGLWDTCVVPTVVAA